jgi:hypothetical protein
MKMSNALAAVAVLVADVVSTEAAASVARELAMNAARTRIDELIKERQTSWDAATEELAALKVQFKALGGVFPRKAREPQADHVAGDSTLIATVARIMNDADGPLSPTEVSERVVAAGYVTKSETNLRTMVSQCLTNLKQASKGRGRNKEWIVNNETRGQWTKGSGMKAYLKEMEAAAEPAAS